MSATQYYFLSENYLAVCERRYPWWQHVFFHGYATREDRIVDWVIQSYRPGDGRERYPLIVHRNMHYVPAIYQVESAWVVSREIADVIRSIGSDVEFLPIVYNKPYSIPWLTDGEPSVIDSQYDEDILKEITKKQYRSSPPDKEFVEIIAPFARADDPPHVGPDLHVRGDLVRTRTTSLSNRIDVCIPSDVMRRYKIFAYEAGLVIDADIYAVLRSAADPNWLAFDELHATEVH